MRQSELFAKIKKEPPKDARAVSHKYLTRGDFIEQTISGVYRFLPLGYKVLKKIEGIIREEMLGLGAEELYLPALQQKSLWMETNRWETIDPPLFKLKDRHQKETALGSTHEEEITDAVRRRIKSYQNLPLYLFQIQDKFRNELRPSGGLLRTREFLMKDLYSFHSDEKDLQRFYEKVKKTYFQIFRRCGLKTLCAEADPGTIGGELSNEFMAVAESGEDKISICLKCSFAANVEKIGERKKCPRCGSDLAEKRVIEVGHIFALGTKYSKAMRAYFVDKSGKERPMVMGCYGIGLPRLMAAVAEINYDERGIIWPKEVAPFRVHLIQIENNQKVTRAAEKIYRGLSSFAPQKRSYGGSTEAFGVGGQKRGIEVLYDDRKDKTAGEKFAEADLIGIPIRMVVSERTLGKNSVEIKKRSEQKTKLVKIQNIRRSDLLKYYVK